MSDIIEAAANGEAPAQESIDPSELSPEQAVAYNAHSSNPGVQNDIQKAWNASIEEVGEPDETPNVPPAKAALAKAKAAKPKAAEADAESDEVDDTAEDEAPAPKGKPEKLTQAESRALIEQRVEMNKRFQRRDASWQAQVNQREQALQSRFQELAPLQEAWKSIEAGDFDGFAKHLAAAHKDASVTDWNSLQAAALQAVSNPMYKRMRQLEKQTAESQQAQQAQQQQAQAQHAEAAKAREIQTWKASLADEVNAADDPAIGNLLTERPQLIDAVFNIQQQHFHETGGDVLSAHDAASKLLQNVRDDFKFWHAYFESHAESDILANIGVPAPKAAQVRGRGATLERQTAKKTSGGMQQMPQPAARPKVVTKNISQAQTAAPSAAKPMSEQQIRDKAIRDMEAEWRQAR